MTQGYRFSDQFEEGRVNTDKPAAIYLVRGVLLYDGYNNKRIAGEIRIS